MKRFVEFSPSDKALAGMGSVIIYSTLQLIEKAIPQINEGPIPHCFEGTRMIFFCACYHTVHFSYI
jgi:hypothetical protein